ncbi:MAG TPA: NADH-quinone oxidoreductase subunit L [Ignavibacteria bacterium]|nr:NADH-quinone oxidoreductase subunit L [Ignavibacteria bacterium]
MEFALNSLPVIVLIIPLLSFVVLSFFSKRLPRRGDWLGTGLLFINLISSFIIFAAFLKNGEYNFSMNWFNTGAGSMMFTVGYKIDAYSALMLIVVNLISSFVHLYSIKYMQDDAKYGRYYAFLGLFTFSMLGIVLTNNILMMYVFWELVGISSYLLIGFWYENKAPQEAAKKAFLVNRVGDFGFLLGIIMIFVFIGNFSFPEIFAGVAAGKVSGGMLTAMGIMLFMGAIGKSAQFPLHVWLPDAMEGPTPVSALIHAATMVAAGVYMTARMFPLFSPDALTVVAFIGTFTAFMAATIALTQNDIKRILAYSTVSQLGYMIMAIGVGGVSFGFFHLVTHAFFKACLFLCAGSVIMGMHHVQDIRDMGGLRKKMPVTYWTMLISTISIVGVPLTSGFMSKDAIISATMAFAEVNGGITYLIPIAALFSALLTAFYMFRLIIKTFFGEPRNQEKYDHCKEQSWHVTVPLIILAVLSFFGFYSFNPLDPGTGWLLNIVKTPASLLANTSNSIYKVLPYEEFEALIHHMHYPAIILSVLMGGLGILIAYLFYYWKKVNVAKLVQTFRPIYLFSLNKWYFDELYDKTFIALTMGLSKLSGAFDKYIIDGIVNGAAYLTRKVSSVGGVLDKYVVDGLVNAVAYIVGLFGAIFRKFQTGKIESYIMFLVFGVIVLYVILRFV